MAFKLTIEQGKGRGQSFDFDVDEITIGRADENDVVLYDGGVSRQHARISVDGDRYLLSDLETANGTLLNGSRVDSEVLENGDSIGLGAVVFRFEQAPAEGATRIVSLEAAKAAAKGSRKHTPASNRTAPGHEAPAARLALNPRTLRLAAIGGGSLIALFIVVGALRGGGDSGGNDCPKPMVFKEGLGAYVFGHGDGDCDAGAELDLEFTHAAKTRVILHYAPFYTDSSELDVVVNGKRIATAPLAPTRRSTLLTLVLPDDSLDEGEVNVISFKNAKGKGETWGVERLELEVIGLNEADVTKAEEAFQLGSRALKERNVAAPNLYNAWMYFREARRYMEGLPDPKPASYRATLDLSRDVEKELDKLCKERLFRATQQSKYDRYDAANEAYKFILAAFPGDAHPCRAQALGNMYIEDAPSGE